MSHMPHQINITKFSIYCTHMEQTGNNLEKEKNKTLTPINELCSAWLATSAYWASLSLLHNSSVSVAVKEARVEVCTQSRYYCGSHSAVGMYVLVCIASSVELAVRNCKPVRSSISLTLTTLSRRYSLGV